MKKTYLLAAFTFLIASFAFTNQASAATTTATTPKIYSQTEVEQKVREYFKDAPVMAEIARCESKFRQYTDAGNVLRGGSGGGMVGVFQFYESIHAAAALQLGFDLTTLEGNMGYARHIYSTQGTTPWNSAKYCWDVPLSKTTTTISSTDREALLKQIDTLTKLISLLQKQLEQKKLALK